MSSHQLNKSRWRTSYRMARAMSGLLISLLVLRQYSYCQQKQHDTLFVYFEFNKSTLQPTQLSQIENLLTKWKPRTSKVLRMSISGYADSTGAADYNSVLSKQRASYIERLLSERLNDPTIEFSSNALGETQSGQHDSLDRRVTIIISFAYDDISDSSEPRVLQLDTIIQLSNIQFVEDQAYLTSQSLSAMPTYISMLKMAYYDQMRIVGYYNLEGKRLQPADPRFILSGRRAKVIADYFIEAGLDSSTISYEGGGNNRMIVENPRTVPEMRKNIRVEVFLYRRK